MTRPEGRARSTSSSTAPTSRPRRGASTCSSRRSVTATTRSGSSWAWSARGSRASSTRTRPIPSASAARHRGGSRVLRGALAGAARERAVPGTPPEARADHVRPYLLERLRGGPRGLAPGAPATDRPRPEWPWAIWYPLRRTGTFARLTPQEQGRSSRSTPRSGRTYGEADLAHDVRLACHGLDTHDNDFVIGLVGRDLHPLSHLVQTMRRTAQTSEFIQTLGPFFIGHVLWRSTGA